MPNCFHVTVIALSALLLAGCTTTYTMNTRTGEVIRTQGKPETDVATGLTYYVDAYGYHREIHTSDITQTTEGRITLDW